MSTKTPYRSAAEVAETIPKAPWKAPAWLGPLALTLISCIVAGGSFDVAYRTGYWGVCVGVSVASAILLICGLVLFATAVKE